MKRVELVQACDRGEPQSDDEPANLPLPRMSRPFVDAPLDNIGKEPKVLRQSISLVASWALYKGNGMLDS